MNAFWSVTMYDGKSQLLIKNPINRYLINSPMLAAMKKNADGSLTLYIQKDSPGKEKEANWLPAPNDTIYLVMRLYWPKGHATFDLAAGRRDMEATRYRGDEIGSPDGLSERPLGHKRRLSRRMSPHIPKSFWRHPMAKCVAIGGHDGKRQT